MVVRDCMREELRECLAALVSDGAYPTDRLYVDEVRWLKECFGDDLKKRGGLLYLDDIKEVFDYEENVC